MQTNLSRAVASDGVVHRINYSQFMSIAFAAIWIFLATTLLALGQEADSPELPKSIARKLQKNVMPPLRAGNHGEFQSQLANIICKLKPESFEQIEAYGLANDSLSLSKAFYAAWRNDVSQGNVPTNLKMKRPVSLYLTSGTTEEINRLLVELQDHDVMNSTEPPEDWLESRNLFLDFDSFKDRMSVLAMMGQFADAVLQPHRKSAKLFKGEAGEILERFQSAAESFAKLEKQVIEKEAVLRLQRLNASAQALREPGDFEKRFVSALFLEEDASALETFFSTPSDLEADELKEPGLAQTTINTISQARNSGNPIVEKARLLTQGLQAWKRGRYGIGDLFNGMLKSRLSPNNSPTASNFLRMPETTQPISQFLGSDSGPGFDRRHYYTWDLEYRPLYSSSEESSKDSTRRDNFSFSPETSQQLVCSNGQPYTRHTGDVEYDETRTQVETTRLYRDWAPQDDSIPPRIVGTQEYSTAIVYLEKLIGMSSAEEIEVYDKVIALLPEFAFYSGMTSGVKQPKPSTGSKVVKDMEDAEPQDVDGQFKKQSLAWLMALAKVELNATSSMYSPGDDAFKPDASSKFGLLEYYHVLLDDVAAHLSAIETDDQFKKAIKKSLKEGNSATLAYLRRLKLISSMLIALEESGDPMINQKSAEYRKTIEQYNLTLVAQAERSAQDLVQTNRKVTTNRGQGKTARIETH